jgi:uncharacterized membrane protein
MPDMKDSLREMVESTQERFAEEEITEEDIEAAIEWARAPSDSED